jgi:hypothetical protein
MRYCDNATPAHKVAPILSQMVACGLLGRDEALAALLQAIAPANVSQCGRHARYPHEQADLSAKNLMTRACAARAVRSSLDPLLKARAGKPALMWAANRAAQSALPPAEVEMLMIGAIAGHLRQARRNRGTCTTTPSE